MKNTHTRNRTLEATAWGLLFVWWGITEMIKSMPDGTGAIGIGLILLGVNAARSLSGIAVSAFTATLGTLALVWGRPGTGGSGPEPAIRVACLCDRVDRAGPDRARARADRT